MYRKPPKKKDYEKSPSSPLPPLAPPSPPSKYGPSPGHDLEQARPAGPPTLSVTRRWRTCRTCSSSTPVGRATGANSACEHPSSTRLTGNRNRRPVECPSSNNNEELQINKASYAHLYTRLRRALTHTHIPDGRCTRAHGVNGGWGRREGRLTNKVNTLSCPGPPLEILLLFAYRQLLLY